KIGGWCLLAAVATLVIGVAGRPGVPESGPLRIALVIWIVFGGSLAFIRVYGLQKKLGPRAAMAALALLLMYWTLLGITHRIALANAYTAADHIANARGEHLLRAAAMPNAATFW